ncbi:hypothetical protein WA026_016572 [Henosepilachna vigintioctopunctata]|uniref:Uncharacterized protein n=1 Tax=Henosepilachna vigintioctopunctata TaxID=420089 RepID=A0AAW1VEL6_9CUCU
MKNALSSALNPTNIINGFNKTIAVENIPVTSKNMEATSPSSPHSLIESTVEKPESSIYTHPIDGGSKDIMPSETTFSPYISRPYQKSAARRERY